MAKGEIKAVNGNAGIVVLGKWLESKFGVSVGEHPAFGGVSCVHTGQCKHYWTNDERASNGASRHYAAAAIDVNHDSGDESKVLNEIYDLLSENAAAFGVKELFYGSRGIPTPVPAHGDHMHIGVDGPPTAALVNMIGGIGDKNLSFVSGAAGDVANFAGDQASKLAKGIVSALLNAIGADGARILLYVALVGGGAILIYYGTARAVGVSKPIGSAAQLAAFAPK